jgi:hypothetical protein
MSGGKQEKSPDNWIKAWFGAFDEILRSLTGANKKQAADEQS